MKLLSYSPPTDKALARFDEATTSKTQIMLALLREKLKLCDYEILLISYLKLHLDELDNGWNDPKKLISLNNAWRDILGKGLTNSAIQKKAWSVIDEIGEPLSPNYQKNDTPFIRRFREDPTGKHFFILLTGNEPEGLPVYDLNFLCNLWQLEHGFTSIHSASIIHKGKLFLFCGSSGAGKSTIAEISAKRNDTVLDEDLVIIPRLPTKDFSARAWGYSLDISTAPLCAIFKIVQADEERLIPLKQPQTAHFLVERSIEVLGNPLHDRMMDKLFKQIAAIARCVPGYELHFRKRPDFWKLIDEQILP